MIWILAIGVTWVVCGILAYGFTLGYFQREYPRSAKYLYESTRRVAFSMAALGPFGLGVSWAGGEYWKHGLMFRRPKYDTYEGKA